MKIALVGPYPPPYGGISVHIQRMEALLLEQGPIPVVFSQGGAKKWLLSHWGKWSNFDVIHFHDIAWKSRVLIGLLGFLGFKVVLTIHGDGFKYQLAEGNWIQKRLLGFAMRHITHIVCVKDETRELLLSLGVKSSHISVINAYLSPVFTNDSVISQPLHDFLKLHTPLVVANGFQVNLLSKKIDIYGIEMTIDLCARLAKDYPKVGCLFFLAQIGDQKRYDELTEKISCLGLNGRFCFIIGESFTPVLKQATLFVRPTFTDGYGVSVTEALYFGIPALASDVCEREKGAVIFKCGDSEDFYRRTRQILDDYEAAKQALQAIKPMSTYESLLDVYQRVGGGR